MPSKLWSEMVTTDFSQVDPENTIVLMPVGSTEQHGPHLPLCVDACITEGVAARIRELLPNNLSLLVLPTMPIGKSNEHMAFPGTLTLTAETLLKVWGEIIDSVVRAGLKKIVILNGHGGQTQIAEIVARDARVKHKILCVAVNWWSVRLEQTLFSQEEYKYGIHGGAEETSMMMCLKPHLVRRDHCRNFPPISQKLSEQFPILLGNVPRFGWQAQDLEPSGACGDASAASAEKGSEIVDNAATSLIKLLQELQSFSVDHLK